MYAHVTTYRLGTSQEVAADLEYVAANDGVVSDQTARTIASWYHSPNLKAITSLSHGLPFDTVDLAEEVGREVTDPVDSEALLDWVYQLEQVIGEWPECATCGEPIDYCPGHGVI